MKQFLIILFCFLLTSCYLINKPHEITVINNSSYDVSFSQQEKTDTYNINKNETIFIPVYKSAWPKIEILNNVPVKANYPQEFKIELVNIPPINLTVENNTNSEICFSIKNQPVQTKYIIASKEKKQVLIYTSNPVFECEYLHYNFSKELMDLYFY